MPFKDPEKSRAYHRERMRKKRESEEFRAKEAAKKAEWFKENRVRLAQKKREMRQQLREQAVQNQIKKLNDEK